MTIGIDIDAEYVKAGLIEGGVIFRKIILPFPSEESQEHTIAFLKENVICKLINSNIKGIGIGVPSVVDSSDGIVYNALHIPSWEKVSLKSILEEAFSLPVVINNDTNCLAFAERYYGEGTLYRNLVALKLSTGVGAGIIINDVLYSGCNIGAGEVGSMFYLDSNYESYCSSLFFKMLGLSVEEALQKAESGNQETLLLWKEFGFHLGSLLKTILFAYDPQAIILAGELTKGYDYFREDMEKSLSSFPYPQIFERVKIILSKKEDIELLGAAALIP